MIWIMFSQPYLSKISSVFDKKTIIYNYYTLTAVGNRAIFPFSVCFHRVAPCTCTSATVRISTEIMISKTCKIRWNTQHIRNHIMAMNNLEWLWSSWSEQIIPNNYIYTLSFKIYELRTDRTNPNQACFLEYWSGYGEFDWSTFGKLCRSLLYWQNRGSWTLHPLHRLNMIRLDKMCYLVMQKVRRAVHFNIIRV